MPVRASAIIVAAGSGQRLGSTIAKAFVPLGGESILFYSMRSLAAVPEVTELVVTLPEGDDYRAAAREIAKRSAMSKPMKLVRGGNERQDSVRIGLALTSAESEVVAVHDAARPFATADLFRLCIEAAALAGGAIAAIAVADTLKQVAGGVIVATRGRAGLYQAQTPQAFRRDLLFRAHEMAAANRIAATDDADLVERIGGKVAIVEGSARNIKITTKSDLEVAEAFVAKGASTR